MSSISLTLGLRGRLLSGTQVTLQGALFGNNEPGFTFEPWDITTLYQDRAGTTLVTAAGQSVGLRLDKSQRLRIGPELVTNGDFSAGSTGWTVSAGWVISTSAAATATSSSLYGGIAITVSGRYYKIEFDVVSYTSGTLAITVGGNYTGNVVLTGAAMSPGRKSVLVQSGSMVSRGVEFYGGTITATIDNISVRELAGNHEVAVSDAKLGIYGWMPKTGKRNLLTFTERFDNAIWVSSTATVSADTTVAPDGSTTADKIIATATTGYHTKYQSYTALAASYTVSVYAKAAEYSKLKISDVVLGSLGAQFDLASGTLIALTAGTSASITRDPVTGWCRCSVAFTPTAAARSVSFVGYPDSGATQTNFGAQYTGDGTSGVYVWGAQLEVGSTATAYQRVVSQYDITEAGVPTCYYVQADGVDDAYVTPTITPNTDKVQVFAGVRKLSDATRGLLAEFSATPSINSFTLFAPNSLASEYAWTSRGTIPSLVTSATTYPAPISNVITGLGDISGDTATLRVNGVQVAQSTADQGTGNYLAYPAYLYARNGTTLPFNGLDFGHAVRFGPNLDAATIARVESLIARNTPEVTL